MNRFQSLFDVSDCRDQDPQLAAPDVAKILVAANDDGSNARDWLDDFIAKRQRAVLGMESFQDEMTLAKSARGFLQNELGKILPGDLLKFIPFAKVDAVKREVSGIVTAEQPDKDLEICDYEKSKPYYQKWSDEFRKATDGASVGNLREMHQLSAVGKAIDLRFNDADKEIEMVFKVVDPEAWKKVEERVYTGFSQGGRKVEQYPDPVNKRYQRYVANPSEVSLVDNPCLPSARFAYVKADGSVEMRKFLKVAEAVALAKASSKVKDGDDEIEIQTVGNWEWKRTRRGGKVVALQARDLTHGNSAPVYYDSAARKIGHQEYLRLVGGQPLPKAEFPRSSENFVTKLLGASQELMTGCDPLGRW